MNEPEPSCGVRGERVFIRRMRYGRSTVIGIEIQHSGKTPGLLKEDSRGQHRYALLRKSEARDVAVKLAELAGLEEVLATLDALVMLDED